MPDPLLLPHGWPEVHDEIGIALVKIEENIRFIGDRCVSGEMMPFTVAAHLRDLAASVREARVARHA